MMIKQEFLQELRAHLVSKGVLPGSILPEKDSGQKCKAEVSYAPSFPSENKCKRDDDDDDFFEDVFSLFCKKSDLKDFIKENKKSSFRDLLFQMIDERGESDADIYRRADLDRRLFSKIRNDGYYHPSKSTVIALALALELNKEKMKDLLESAGYSLSESVTADLIISYCVEHGMYRIVDVNEVLVYFDQPLI